MPRLQVELVIFALQIVSLRWKDDSLGCACIMHGADARHVTGSRRASQVRGLGCTWMRGVDR